MAHINPSPVQSGTFVQFPQALPSIPLFTTKGQALGAALAIPGDAWSWVDVASYGAAPAGKTLQMRLHVVFAGGTAGDVYGADLFDPSTATSPIAVFTAVAGATSGSAEALSGWVAMPTARAVNPRVQNQTAVRGVAELAWLELQYR